jgi:hypothetical protein
MWKIYLLVQTFRRPASFQEWEWILSAMRENEAPSLRSPANLESTITSEFSELQLIRSSFSPKIDLHEIRRQGRKMDNIRRKGDYLTNKR